MIKKILLAAFALTTVLTPLVQSDTAEKISYKCLIQLTNYGGEGAYLVLSLVNAEGEYEQTLLVNGNDHEWYQDLPDWYKHLSSTFEDIDGLTGASISSGGRKVAVIDIDADKMKSGYKIRFETAVEDKKYYNRDLEVDLGGEVAGQRFTGEGYIRYVQLIQK